MKRLAMYIGIGATALVAMTVGQRAEAGDSIEFIAGDAGYNEECEWEGCDAEEREELYTNGDYAHECLVEGCDAEEPLELAVPVDGRRWTPDTARISCGNMLWAFSNDGFNIGNNGTSPCVSGYP